MKTRICGTGSVLPKHVVSNDDLSKIMDTSDEWITSRTGIRRRHLAVEETLTSLSAEASMQAVKEAGILPEELDMILAATLSPDAIVPCLACELQRELGAVNAVAFDINAACSGFLFALQTADAYIKSGRYRKILVVGGEIFSKLVDWADRSTCILFGDGAGAVVVTADENYGIMGLSQGSDGSLGQAILCENRRNNNPCVESDKEWFYTKMQGQDVYRFAVRTVPKMIVEAIEDAQLKVEDIDWFILHQANIRIIESVAKRLDVSMDKFPTNLDECGNVPAASVPLLLDQVNREGKLHRGDKIVLAGFGGGLTWGAAVLSW